MTDAEIESLKATRANYVQQLLDLSSPATRKVTYSIGGRSISWTEYQKQLLTSIQELDQFLNSLGIDQPAGGFIITAAQ